jgi:hypothetical protein
VFWFFVALSLIGLVVLLDAQRRYGKAAWFLGGLAPLTLGLTALAYLVVRFLKKPGPEAPYPLAANGRAVVGGVILAVSAGLLFQVERMESDKQAQVQEARKQHAARVKAIAEMKDPYERAMARKEMKLPYTANLQEVPAGHAKFAAAQAELRTLSQESSKQRQPKPAESPTPRFDVVKVEEVKYEKNRFDPAQNVTVKVVIAERPVTAALVEQVARLALARRYDLPVSSMKFYDTLENANNAERLDSLSDAERKRYRNGLLGSYVLTNSGGELTVTPRGIADPQQKTIKF